MAQEQSPVLSNSPPSPLPSPVSPLSPSHHTGAFPTQMSPVHLSAPHGLPQEPRRSNSFHNASPGTTIVEKELEEGTASDLYSSSTIPASQPAQANVTRFEQALADPENQFLAPAENVAIKKTSTNDQIFITIQPGSASSLAQVGTTTNQYNHRFSMETVDDPGMWPPRKFLQKRVMKKKRVRIALKVTLAVVIIVGAAAIGLGINKAVQDGKKG